jgi:hypothetical protein
VVKVEVRARMTTLIAKVSSRTTEKKRIEYSILRYASARTHSESDRALKKEEIKA